jgi:hypothetical protein
LQYLPIYQGVAVHGLLYLFSVVYIDRVFFHVLQKHIPFGEEFLTKRLFSYRDFQPSDIFHNRSLRLLFFVKVIQVGEHFLKFRNVLTLR